MLCLWHDNHPTSMKFLTLEFFLKVHTGTGIFKVFLAGNWDQDSPQDPQSSLKVRNQINLNSYFCRLHYNQRENVLCFLSARQVSSSFRSETHVVIQRKFDCLALLVQQWLSRFNICAALPWKPAGMEQNHHK